MNYEILKASVRVAKEMLQAENIAEVKKQLDFMERYLSFEQIKRGTSCDSKSKARVPR